jgi:hypothetical protein
MYCKAVLWNETTLKNVLYHVQKQALSAFITRSVKSAIGHQVPHWKHGFFLGRRSEKVGFMGV